MSEPTSVVELALVKSYLQIAHTAQDEAIQALIDGAEEWVAQWLGSPLSATEFTEDLDGGEYELRTRWRPIIDVTEILDRDDSDAAMDFDLDSNGRILRADTAGSVLRSRWPEGAARYRVSYVAGYEDLPAAIQTAVLMLVSRAYHQRTGETGGTASGVAVNWGPLMQSDVISLLKPYRRTPVAAV